MDAIYQRLVDTNFCIKDGYVARMNPSYFDDFLSTTENITHQPDVYQFAVFLAKKFDCENIIDIGCGSGDKLKDISSDFQLLGVDLRR